MTDAHTENGKTWLDANIGRFFPWNLENILAVILLALAVLTRFYGLGDRVVSHDEVNHLEPSYTLSQGGGFQFSPMTHGPLQMHLIAFSFVLFGDNDFTARLPAAIFSIVTVGIGLFLFRRYLGRTGALIAGLLLLISPYMLYYGRYQRNEAFIVVWSLLTLYAILRYLERGEKGVLILFTVVNALHFTDKTTSYMYAAAQVVFLAGYFFIRILRRPWSSRRSAVYCLVSLTAAAALLVTSAIILSANGTPDLLLNLPALLIGLAGLAAGVSGVIFLVQGVGGPALRGERSLDLFLLIGALTIPLSAAVPMRLVGIDPQTDVGAGLAAWLWIFLPAMTALSLLIYHLLPDRRGRIVQPFVLLALGLLGMAVPGLDTPQFFIIYFLIAAAVTLGVLWDPKWWSILATIFFGIYIIFFTTLFTNWNGLADGVFKFLAYWVSVQLREGHLVYEPWYYYLLIEIPIYEYLPAIGAILALILCIARGAWMTTGGKPFEKPVESPDESPEHPVPVMPLFLFWAVFNLAIFSYASEKMPQQTMLIAAPMILATAWGIGYLVEARHGPFLRSARKWIFVVFAGLAFLTARTAYTAAFINYDLPFEYMAYAHGAPGPKIVLEEIEKLSRLTTGGTDLVVAYDNDVRYPYWWYMRHYKNKIDFDVNPTSDILRAPIIAVGQANNEKVAAIVGDKYVSFRLPRLWWHNQDFWDIDWDRVNTEYTNNAHKNGITDPPPMSFGDYLSLVWGHIRPLIADPKTRAAVFQIWLNRDYTLWSEVRGNGGYTLADWSLVEWMHVYIRKDVLGFLAGSEELPGTQTQGQDLYELARIELLPDQVLGGSGSDPGQFLAPRGIAPAPDGSLYVADSQNHRIQHFDSAGQIIGSWGTYASIDTSDAPGGTFNEPWGVAVGPDGSVYVADTWNHRIQKFTADGEFVTLWGSRTVAEGTLAFYGPRAIAVDGEGRVFVADTGNKRIVVFDSDGGYLTQFGTAGAGPGNFDEPVGIALDSDGRVFVADTWNRRVQIFAPNRDGTFSAETEWPVNAWYGTSPEFKPYLVLDSARHVYLSDPSTCRLIEFNERGLVLAVWGQCGEDNLSLNGPTGLALDSAGGVWVSDSQNNRLVHYLSPNGAQGAVP
jgi:predicted membrane-bound mannosyltransferase/DNA-binding beta-propeller fold protein YncE